VETGVVWLPLAAAVLVVLFVFARDGGLPLQLFGIAAAVVLLLSLPGCEPYDPGGDPKLAITNALAAQRTGAPTPIRGSCYSSCVAKLASGRGVCVAPSAHLGVHEVRRAKTPWDYANGVADPLWTGFFEGVLPQCAQRLFDSRHAFDSGTLIVFSGEEVLAACPQVPACTDVASR
jgi:hypothetical protein